MRYYAATMANTKSARKANRQTARRRIFNLRRKAAMKETSKRTAFFIGAKNAKDAAAQLPGMYQALDKAAKNGTIHPNKAARMKSRITKRLAALSD